MGRAAFWRRGKGAVPASAVRFVEHPHARTPVLVAAFEGWNDAGEAASTALSFLAQAWDATPLGEIDGEEFFDFTQARPEVAIIRGETRRLRWPATAIAAAPALGRAPRVAMVSGPEPHLRWRTYAASVVAAAKELGVRHAVLLGAYLSEVTHHRPVPLSGTATDETLLARHNLAPTRYEGPTGMVGVLGEAFQSAGMSVTTLWASVPCYSLPVSPKAALALARVVALSLERAVVLDELEEQAVEYERRMDELVEEDEGVAAYVARLEEMEEPPSEASVDGLTEEIERYLRGKR